MTGTFGSAMPIHFMAGLPRSGSTLLAAIMKQNPRYHVVVCSPVYRMFDALRKGMSASDGPLTITNDQRLRILRSMVEAYHGDRSAQIVIDSNRGWCGSLSALAELFPASRVICCLRNPAWIIDSTERVVQRHPLQYPRMFGDGGVQTVYERADQMWKNPYLKAVNAVRQAWFGEHARLLVAIRYESLVQRPSETMARLYDLLGEPPFIHQFEHVAHEEPELDAYLGMPGLHTVAPPVEMHERQTILPPDLFRQYDSAFWEMSGQNPRRVPLL